MGNLGEIDWTRINEFAEKYGRDSLERYVALEWKKHIEEFQVGDLVRITLDQDAAAFLRYNAKDHRFDQITAIFLGTRELEQDDHLVLVAEFFTEDEEQVALGYIETNKIELLSRPDLEGDDDEI